MRVLFTHSYFLKFDDKQLKTAMPYPPLGTLYAMAYLREMGFEVKLFDTMFCDSPQEIYNTIKNFKPQILISYDDCFNYLTKMCLTNMREACFKIQQLAKKEGCKVITCSSDSTDHTEEYLSNGADVVAIGEGEQTIFEVCNAFKNNSSLKDINGIAYNKNSVGFKTSPRAVIRDLDALPAPAWDLLDISPYKKMWQQHHGYFSLNFVTTRGCPYKCNWCAKPIYGNRYNSHHPAQIVKQIKQQKQVSGFTHVWFADDIFGLKPSWVIQFAEECQKQDLNISYKIQSRADLLVKEDYVKALAVSGCKEVWMGAESGSQKVLDAMDKGTTVEEIIVARQLLKKYQIKAAFFLQYGYLGEKYDDILKTLALVESTMPDDIGISVSYPLPGTKFYDKVRNDLSEKQNWKDSDELALMFKNTYPPEFYKILHRLTHSIYRKQKAAVRYNDSGKFSGRIKPALSFMKYSVKEFIQRRKLKQQMI